MYIRTVHSNHKQLWWGFGDPNSNDLNNTSISVWANVCNYTPLRLQQFRDIQSHPRSTLGFLQSTGNIGHNINGPDDSVDF